MLLKGQTFADATVASLIFRQACPFQIFFQLSVSILPRDPPLSQLWQGTTRPSGVTAMLLSAAPQSGADSPISISASGGIIGHIKTMVTKAENYYSWNQGGWVDQVKNSGLYTVARIFCAGIVAFTLYVLLKEWFHKGMKEYSEGRKNSVILKSEEFSSFMIIYLLFTAQTFLIAAPECFRFVFPALPYIGMIYMEATMNKQVDNDDLLINRAFLVLAGLAGIVINVYNMNSMIPVGKYLLDSFSTGIIRILLGA